MHTIYTNMITSKQSYIKKLIFCRSFVKVLAKLGRNTLDQTNGKLNRVMDTMACF